MIKVVHIQYSVESGGRAALRLQKAFAKVNVMSNIISLIPSSYTIDNIKYMGIGKKIKSKIDNKIQGWLTRKVIRKMGAFSYPLLGTNVANIDEIKNADFIYIHWALNGFLNFKSVAQIASLNKPVVIFLHDMWNITGGCHHSFACDKYKTSGCNNCPMLSNGSNNDLSAKEFKKKIKLYSNFKNLYFISPSQWLYNCAKESLLTKDKPIFYIPNILDNSLFKPIDKKIAKQILNINENETVIAFGAIAVDSPYKGWSYLQKALEILKQDEKYSDLTVLIFGDAYNKTIADAIPFKTKFMGYLKDEYSTALIYNAVNVFIAPSLAEAFGYVIMEAQSCGTPVVGFNVGGIPDIISHKENGYLAKYKDAEDLAVGIKYCLQNEVKGKLLPHLIPSLTIQKHLDLFETITPLNKN